MENSKKKVTKKVAKKIPVKKPVEKKEVRVATIRSEGNFWKNNRGTIIVIGVVVLLLAMTLLIEGNNSTNSGEPIDYSSLSKEVQTWYNDTQSNEPVVSVIALSYCHYCEEYKPIITELTTNEGIKLHWFEIDTMAEADSNALTSTYKLEGYSGSSPYTFVTKGGVFLKDTVGYMPLEDASTFLKEAGAID